MVLDRCEMTYVHPPRRTVIKRLLAVVVSLPVLGVLALYSLEQITGDAATRLSFQIRNQSILLRMSGAPTRTFAHSPWRWPEGVAGDYRIEIKEGANPTRPGERFIGVALNWTEPTWYWTTYHLNYVVVPADLAVAHRKGERALVTLEKRDGKILLTKLE